ncbi:hypothetical protein [Streptomyces sp. MBT55]|uniref:hypothetical protein n=1 Tax=Streptomyces sp. MBT55 TaxID=1488386 RepID=UPI001F17403A|nr:hypothetical protein [Streptomyces sp. MBT55]
MRALGRAVADPAAHLIAVTGGTAAELPGIAAERTGSFQRKADAGAPMRPGAAALPAPLERHRVPFALVSASPQAKGWGALRLHRVRARRGVCRAGRALAAAG